MANPAERVSLAAVLVTIDDVPKRRMDVSWLPGDVPKRVAGSAMSMQVTKKNGLFSGTFYDPKTTRWENFGGAFLQPQGRGIGSFAFPGGQGVVTITPRLP